MALNYYNGVYSVTQSGSYSGSQNYLTPVGAFTASSSYYGTYDQEGNVLEWIDGVRSGQRWLNGGAWDLVAGNLPVSASFLDDEGARTVSLGFRLAAAEPVPEPTGIVTGLLCAGVAALRRRRRS